MDVRLPRTQIQHAAYVYKSATHRVKLIPNRNHIPTIPWLTVSLTSNICTPPAKVALSCGYGSIEITKYFLDASSNIFINERITGDKTAVQSDLNA